MRIVDMQRRLRERGRIRLGYSTPHKTKAGIKVPHKLDTFRFTAADEATVAQVAQLYGGTPERWDGQDQWQVTTQARQLSVVFATEVAFSQSYEHWAGGFMRRLCDGQEALVPSTGRRMVKEPCACDPDERECQLTTHLKLILPELPGLGTWRLVTHGYNAATELLAAVELIEGALGAGLVRVPARLMIEKRERRRLQVQDDGSTKPVTFKFPVPVLELEGSVAALGAGMPSATSLASGVAALDVAPTQVALPAGPAPTGWKPVEQAALAPAPEVPMSERLDVGAPPKKRRNSPPDLPSTGRRPRTGSEAEASESCSVCGKGYGSEAVVRNPDPEGSRYIHRSCRSDGQPASENTGVGVTPGGAPVSAEGDEDAERTLASSEPAGGVDVGSDAPDATPPAPTVDDGAERVAGSSLGSAPSSPRKRTAAAKKAAANAGTRMMSHGQHATVMGLSAKVFPALDGEPVDEANHRRRGLVLALCALLGQPGLESRSGITASTATPLIETLKGIEEERLAFNGEQLIDRSTGEPIVWGSER